MMQAMANIEEGRVPLAAREVEAELRMASVRGTRQDCFLGVTAVLDIAMAPFVLLIGGQLTSWSLTHSLGDWLPAVIFRGLATITLLAVGRRRQQQAITSRWIRYVASCTLFILIVRLIMLDWSGHHAIGNFLPVVTYAALMTLLIALVAHLRLRTCAKIEKMQAESENQGTTESTTSAPGDETSQYSSGLSFFQTMKVLKPYFWPSTGGVGELCISRMRATLTWVCVVLSKLCNIISPVYLAAATNAIHDAMLEKDRTEVDSSITRPLILYAFLCFASKALTEVQRLLYIKVQQAAYIEIADGTFVHLHSLSLDWHLKKKMGNVIKSMDRGIAAAQQTMQYVCLNLFPTLCEAVVVTFIFWFHFQNLRLAIFVAMNLYLYIYATIKVTLWRKRFRTAATKHDNQLHDRLTDSLVNYETVKYFAAEEYERREYTSLVRKYQTSSMATTASMSVLNMIQQVFVNTALAGGMIIASASVLQQTDIDRGKRLGAFVAVNVYIMQVFAPLSFLGTIYNMVVNALVDMHNFGQLLAESCDVQDQPGATTLDLTERPDTPMVEFRNVSFNYSKQPLGRSIKQASFKLERGKSVALVGTTGAGKTTITRLLFRFYDVTGGQVLINGQDVRNVTQQSLRKAIGMVPQDVVMFNSTIAHNIRYGRIDDATQTHIESAAAHAQLDKFVEEQADRYDTVVGERGLKLSGGEKQRLAIARCMVKDPPIVVLDEATSALDSQTEERVQQALEVLSSKRTVIAIAHRLSTIRNYDEILVLEMGEVVERGTHDALLAKEGSKYSAMWQRQAKGITEDNPADNNSADGEGKTGAGGGMPNGCPVFHGGGGHGGGHGHGHGA